MKCGKRPYDRQIENCALHCTRDRETIWDGVTNPTAVKHLHEVKPGTR